MDFSRRATLKVLIALLGVGRPVRALDLASAGPPSLGNVDWNNIRAAAANYVNNESPADSWPFERSTGSGNSKRVWAHYFPPFPLSIDNKSSESDSYKLELLSPSGEGGKFAAIGGLLRDRPLPLTPSSSPRWRELNYAIEIARARLVALDGFGVDVPTISGPLWDEIKMLFSVADGLGFDDFHLIPEPDLNAMRDISPDSLAVVLDELSKYKSVYRLGDGRLVVAPYNADIKPPEFWQQLMAEMTKRGTSIVLWPIFLNKPLYVKKYPGVAFPYAKWGNSDLPPASDASHFPRARKLDSSLVLDSISPQHIAPKASKFREAQNTNLFRMWWQQLIADDVPNIQIVTWNDYTEGTQISPSVGIQFLFYDLSLYYLLWYKGKKAPSITRDAIFYCHRGEIIDLAVESRISRGKMNLEGPNPIHNEIEMLAFLLKDAKLQIEIAGEKRETMGSAGLVSFRAPARPGRPIFRLLRDDKVILEKVSDWPIAALPSVDNPEYVGGSSTRKFVRWE